MPGEDQGGSIRLLVVARQPLQLGDLGLDGRAELEGAQLIRRPGAIELAIEESDPNVVLVDTGFPEGRGFGAIEKVVALAPDAAVLALTPDPPPHDHVARATRAGAAGFIDVDAEPTEFADALSAVREGGAWFPPDELRPILTAVASDLDSTTSERRSRLTGILLGIIPLTGLIAALMAFMWRKYLGQIGVRPVDLAVDPASRVVDAIIGLLLVMGAFGPLLLVPTWLSLLRGSRIDRGPISWFLDHRRTAQVVVSLLWLVFAFFVTRGPDPLLVLVVGPAVALSLIAQALDVSSELPPFLRIEISPMRILIGGLVALVLFFGLLGGEVLLLGPEFRARGSGGLIVPRVLGFKAQPMRAFNVATGEEPRDVLYLGGNADLYVLVDPCNDDTVEFVSVGAHRLEVIDEVSCPASDEP